MSQDSIADMLTQIRNAQMRRNKSVELEFSSLRKEVGDVLAKQGKVESIKVFKAEGKKYKGINISLKYEENGTSAITRIARVSKPSLRSYIKAKDIKPVLGGFGFYIMSTSRGVMTSVEAREKNLGGEIICEVY